jgi:hypothetical protein
VARRGLATTSLVAPTRLVAPGKGFTQLPCANGWDDVLPPRPLRTMSVGSGCFRANLRKPQVRQNGCVERADVDPEASPIRGLNPTRPEPQRGLPYASASALVGVRRVYCDFLGSSAGFTYVMPDGPSELI